MKTITIKAEFPEGVNNLLILDVFSPNSSAKPYDFKKTFISSFEETLVDLEDNSWYHVDLVGYTTGKLEVTISGQFNSPNPIEDSFEKTGFSRGFTIQTKS